jgi:hypothetical protein
MREKRTGGSSNTIGTACTAIAAHLLEACRIAVAAAAVVFGVLVRGEAVGAAPLAAD